MAITADLVLRAGEIALGIAVALLTLLDVFDTVVVPGFTRGWLRVAPRVRRLSLPLWKRRAASLDGPNRISAALAPFIFITTFVLWMGFLVLGFGLIAYGQRTDYTPPIRSLSDALFTAGSAIVTIGESGRDVQGWARCAMLASGFSGLAVVTMAITYILEVQGALQARDAALAKLTTTTGRPPSGLALLETYAELGCGAELGMLLREWRDWMAATLNSHSTRPVLGYFRSTSAEMDWPVATTVVLDAATLYAAFVEGEHVGASRLLHRDGCRMVALLARNFGVDDRSGAPLPAEEIREVVARLAAAGYAVHDGATAHSAFVELRRGYVDRVAALADHFGVERPRLAPHHPSI